MLLGLPSPPLPFTSLPVQTTSRPTHTPTKADDHKEKKPRVRHTEAQLAALNDLYDENEHPSLEDRAALAENMGMETKAVNAWFANKRSANKKKSKGSPASFDTPPPSIRSADITNYDDEDEDDEWLHNYSWSTPPPNKARQQMQSETNFSSSLSEQRHVFEGENAGGIPRRMRMRPSSRQTDELRKLYNVNSHPSREEREELGSRIGMRYQSVTNWFQNQRSLAKKRKEDETSDTQSLPLPPDTPFVEPTLPEPRTYTAFPPASSHPSLAPPVLSSSMLSGPPPHSLDFAIDQKPISSRRSSSGPVSRPRRTRPEPYQLEALKKLFARTPNPSIEERGALALEVGMDLGKVTNWFRNLRQTARKRAAQKSNNEDGDDDGMDFESNPVSRAGSRSPPYSSTSSSMNGDDAEQMDVDGEYGPHAQSHSDMGSEEDYQEAVTPPPVGSPSPPPASKSIRRRMDLDFLTGSPSHDEKPVHYTKNTTSVRLEDAHLLLSFSRHIPQWWVAILPL